MRLLRVRHRTFFDIWPNEVGKYDVATETDIRTLPGYQSAKTTHTLAVTEPSINPDTGSPIISMRSIFRGVEFLGCASANITVDVLSRFLDKHRASAGSTTFVADRNNGKIIAFPDKQKGVRIENGTLKIATLADIDDPVVREAHRQHVGGGADRFVFQSPINGEEFVAAFRQFSGGFGPALAGDHVDADRRFRGDVEENQSIDDGRDHCPHHGRVVLHLLRFEPAIAPGRKRVPAIAGH